MRASGFRDALSLVKHGVPYEKAMTMSAARRLAHVVAFGELDGRTFDWHALRWERDD